jgi:hypothetical protein
VFIWEVVVTVGDLPVYAYISVAAIAVLHVPFTLHRIPSVTVTPLVNVLALPVALSLAVG